MKKKFNILCLLIILIISISGCTSQEELLTKELEVYITNAQRSVAQLKEHIDKGLEYIWGHGHAKLVQGPCHL